MSLVCRQKIWRMVKPVLLSILVLSALSCSQAPNNKIVAFPGAEGFGANSRGGLNGKVIEVTNLQDSGVGSLRAAIEAKEPRIVVFQVEGTIELLSRIRIENPFITISGETAPGMGITVKNHPSNIRSPIEIKTHDVIMRYLRFRPGPSSELSDTVDALTISAGYNIIIDHCSFSWATDEIINTWNDIRDITIQWSIIAEGLDKSSHPKGRHSKGMLLGSTGAERISIHHNLFAHNYDRNIDTNCVGVVDLVNNVFYDAARWTEIKDKYGNQKVNIIGNYYKLGPSSLSNGYEVFYYRNRGREPRVYVKGNIGFHRPAENMPDDLIVSEDSRWMIENKPFPSEHITTTSAFEAYDLVLKNAGAILPLRDAIDERIVKDTLKGTGKVIDDPRQVGGWQKMDASLNPTR
jgi:pectate lyase